MISENFYPEGVLYGHFLDVGSEDAAISGSSAETHPSLWGGTLLLTKRAGKWTPLWYKSGLITRACRKATMPSGREVLFCEEEDAGMGHQVHYVYSVDFRNPMDARKTILVSTDSYKSNCTVHEQKVEHVAWSPGDRLLTITVQTPTWQHDANTDCAGDPPPTKRPPRQATFAFQLTDDGSRAKRTSNQ